MVLIGVHSSKGEAEMQSAIKDWGITWPVAFDPDGKLMKAFACDSFPDYCVIDRSGKIRVIDMANSELERVLPLLIAEKAP